MIIRPGAPSDQQAFSEIKCAAWRKAYAHILPASILDGLDSQDFGKQWTVMMDDHHAHVAEIDGLVVGYATLGPNRYPDHPPKFELWSLYVHPDFAGKGVGFNLVQHMSGIALWHGSAGMIIASFEQNHAARKFYSERCAGRLVGSGTYPIDEVDYPDVVYQVDADFDSLEAGSALTVTQAAEQTDFPAITDFLHRCYERNAAAGLRFNATHQTPETTQRRLLAGEGLLVNLSGRLAATVTLESPDKECYGTFCPNEPYCELTQFAVAPELRQLGLGRWIEQRLCRRARELDRSWIALDTAVEATGLITLYQSWGYEVVGEIDYRPGTNYLSVVMAKKV
ncbi:MAG: GNAT family N-acetyltransferase [Armatimonadetes bacterium]|nr:GNAT family N-acetyltransferase [Armatimonadota bacterium]